MCFLYVRKRKVPFKKKQPDQRSAGSFAFINGCCPLVVHALTTMTAEKEKILVSNPEQAPLSEKHCR